MNISISPETQRLPDEKLQTGQYSSTDDLLRAALMALDDQENELDRDTANAIHQAEKFVAEGRVYDWKDVREQVKAKLSGR